MTTGGLPQSSEPPVFNDPEDADCYRRYILEQRGSVPYTDLELVQRRIEMAADLAELLAEAEELGITPEEMAEHLGEGEVPPQVTPQQRVQQTIEIEQRGEPVSRRDDGEPEEPCCTEDEIKRNLFWIKVAYRNLVKKTNSWLGCQTWAGRVHAAIARELQPNTDKCWWGRYIWRASVYPFGTVFPFGDGDIFLHHAYMVCPCTCKDVCDDCLVLDPYTKTGFAFFQSARIYSYKDWIKDYQVTHVSETPDIDQESIYLKIAQHYQGKISCKLVLDLIKKEYKRYLKISGRMTDQQFEETWERSPLSKIQC